MASTQEYLRFVNCEPQSVIELRTVEVYSPHMPNQFYVFNTEPAALTLEPDAPRFANQTVTFVPVGGAIEEPEIQAFGEQQLTITIAGLDGRVWSAINTLGDKQLLEPISLIYRKYISNDLTKPAVTPLSLQIVSVVFEGIDTIKIVAEDNNLAGTRAGAFYLPSIFKGLLDK